MLLLMNEKELTRLKKLDRVIEKNTTPTLAAIELGLSRSQLYRLLQSYWTCPDLIPALIDDYLRSRRQDYGTITHRRV